MKYSKSDNSESNMPKLKGTTKVVNVTPFLPTQYGYEQFVLLPVQIINGCVSNRRMAT